MVIEFEKFSKVLFLGPRGSYSDAAKQNFEKFYAEDVEFIELNSIYKIVRTLIDKNSSDIVAILPIENSIEGVVRETQDKLFLLEKLGIRILAETRLSIEHSLIGFAKEKEEIEIITSHPQALAQCREYLFKNFESNIVEKQEFSTSASVASLTPTDTKFAAIGSEFCAKYYGVPVIESKINDEENNTTRFILLSKIKPQKRLNNKVSIIFSTENKSGALNKVLAILEKYDLNLSYIDSRPSRKELGEYLFYADFEGYIDDNNVALALVEIESVTKMLSVLSEGAICC